MKKGKFNKNKHYYSKQQPSLSRRRVTLPEPRKPRFSRRLAALKIQKVFRGFLVRKSVNKISLIRNEVVKLEQRLNNEEFINLVRDNDKERLRVNENLMNLLFKLDSIRGVDSGVRDFRKSVTKKVIALQEKLDLVASQKPRPPSLINNNNSDTQFCQKSGSDDNSNNTNNNNNDTQFCQKSGLDDSNNNSNNNNDIQFCQKSGLDDNNEYYCSKEMLEKLICDNNDKMMKLMLERSEMQTRVIDSLSRRVEELEKAADFVNDDQLRRKLSAS